MEPKPMKRLLRVTAVIGPVVALICLGVSVTRHNFSRDAIVAAVLGVAVWLLLARHLWHRSDHRTSAFGDVTVRRDDINADLYDIFFMALMWAPPLVLAYALVAGGLPAGSGS